MNDLLLEGSGIHDCSESLAIVAQSQFEGGDPLSASLAGVTVPPLGDDTTDGAHLAQVNLLIVEPLQQSGQLSDLE